MWSSLRKRSAVPHASTVGNRGSGKSEGSAGRGREGGKADEDYGRTGGKTYEYDDALEFLGDGLGHPTEESTQQPPTDITPENRPSPQRQPASTQTSAQKQAFSFPRFPCSFVFSLLAIIVFQHVIIQTWGPGRAFPTAEQKEEWYDVDMKMIDKGLGELYIPFEEDAELASFFAHYERWWHPAYTPAVLNSVWSVFEGTNWIYEAVFRFLN